MSHAPHTRWFLDLMAHASTSGVASVTLPRFRWAAILADIDPLLASSWLQADGTLRIFGVTVKVA